MAVIANLETLPGLVAGADLSSSQFRAVKNNSTAGEVVEVNATSDSALGVLQNDPVSGQEAEVAVGGLAKAEVGTTSGWTAGARVGYNSTGQVIPVAPDTTTDNQPVIGTFPLLAGQGSIAANQIVSILVLPGALRL